jgi:phospholipid/cholesterol/gamma-HCH transport system ATP-binding protein
MYRVRRRMGMLFQGSALFDSMSVGENVAFPLVHHATQLSPSQRRARVEDKLRLVGLPGFQGRDTASLSGGQRKRVGLARAIIMEPEVVLFDEPNSGLDPMTSDAIDELILDMKRALGITFVVISHDIVSTVKVADHIAMLHAGGLVANGPTAEVVRSKVPIVRRFLGRDLVLPEGPDEVARLPSAR